jgi:hypothetical protein
VGGDIPVDSDTLLVTDFMNLKIKPAQSFRDTHKNKVCVHVFIRISALVYEEYYIVFLKKISRLEARARPLVGTCPPLVGNIVSCHSKNSVTTMRNCLCFVSGKFG